MQPIGKFQQILDSMTSIPDDMRNSLVPRLKDLDVSWIAVNQMSFGQTMAIYALSPNKDKILPALKDFIEVMVALCNGITNIMSNEPMPSQPETMSLSRKFTTALQAISDLPDLGVTIAGNFVANLPTLWLSYAQRLVFTWGAVQQIMSEDDVAKFCDLLRQVHTFQLKTLVIKIERGVFHENSTTFRLGEKWAQKATLIFEDCKKKRLTVDECFMAVVAQAPPPWLH